MSSDSLSPPFLELGFYNPQLTDQDSLVALVRAAAEHGATLTGRAWGHVERNARDRRFAAITDALLAELSLKTMDDIAVLRGDPHLRLVQIEMRGASGSDSRLQEKVTLLSISAHAMLHDRHPVAIWTSAPDQGSVAVEQAILDRFAKLIGQVRPAYAAVTVEWGLESPTDMALDARSHAFEDFYLSREHLGQLVIEAVRMKFATDRIDDIADGLLVVSNAGASPVQLASHRLRRSEEVARLIARRLLGHPALP